MKKIFKRIMALLLMTTIIIAYSLACSTNVNAEEKNYLVYGNYAYEVSNNEVTIVGFSFDNKESNITIPSTIDGKKVIKIGDSAFGGHDEITNIVIPDSVRSIGKYAFCNLGITDIKLSNNITKIGNGAFLDCKSLISIEIPYGVEYIGDSAFYDCINLSSVKIPASVTTIGKLVFYNCVKLHSVFIPRKVSSISEYAFFRCYGLNEINVDDNNSVYCSEDGVLFTKDKSALVTYPSAKKGSKYVVPETVKKINNRAFMYCNKLTQVKLPSKLRTIGEVAFSSCENLESINIPQGVKRIEQYAFAYCHNMKKVIIPKSVVYIDDRAFEESDLRNIIICGYAKSIAERFAKSNGLHFQEINNKALSNNSTISATSINLGDAVTLNGVVLNGNDSYVYSYYYKNASSNKWYAIKGYSNCTSVSFSPKNIATYDVIVRIKDSNGKIIDKYFKLKVN